MDLLMDPFSAETITRAPPPAAQQFRHTVVTGSCEERNDERFALLRVQGITDLFSSPAPPGAIGL